MVRYATLLTLLLVASGPLLAEGPVVSMEPISCLPVEDNAVARAAVTGLVSGDSVRLYFRRLSLEVEDFYWLPMHPANGVYWTAFPKPTAHRLTRKELESTRRRTESSWAAWWRAKETSDDRDPNRDLDAELIRERATLGKREARSWMSQLDDEELQAWLEELEYEPVEYFVVVSDSYGRTKTRSPLEVTRVTDDCEVDLTAQEAGLRENLTVGETAPWQLGEELFHWLCDGIVTRLDPNGVHRGDAMCRACVVAWWKTKAFLIPLGSAAPVAGVLINDKEPPEVSPSRP